MADPAQDPMAVLLALLTKLLRIHDARHSLACKTSSCIKALGIKTAKKRVLGPSDLVLELSA